MEKSPLTFALGKGLLLATAFLVSPAYAGSASTIDPSYLVTVAEKKAAKPTPKAAAKKPAGKKATTTASKKSGKPKEPEKPGPLADFGDTEPSADVRHVANWVSYTRNNKKRNFVLVDKKQARVYVFGPEGKLRGDSPILLGKQVGDHTVPGIGNRPISQIKEHEKTTPAGWFFATPGRNTKGEGIIWVDYDAAVSMHRMRMVDEEERRAERMATPEPDDNRISYGCINVPAKFYDAVLRPAVGKRGAYVFVLPETKSPQQMFGSFEVPPKKG